MSKCLIKHQFSQTHQEGSYAWVRAWPGTRSLEAWGAASTCSSHVLGACPPQKLPGSLAT